MRMPDSYKHLERDFINIGSSPYNEDCVQVGDPDYRAKATKELNAFRDQLVREFGDPPEGAELRIKSFPHDFGTYYEVVVYYAVDNDEASSYALKLEGNTPSDWDAEARKVLGL